jgi:hypothetical protein
VAPKGTIGSPAPGSDVQRCSYLSGTSRLPAGTSLLLAMNNQDHDQNTLYLEVVYGYETVAERTTWRGAQYFGDESAVGQDFRVRLLAVDVGTVRKVAAGSVASVSEGVPAGASVLDSVDLTRVTGDGADFPCEE